MFTSIFNQYDWNEELRSIYNKTDAEVRRALARKQRTLDDFKALISPAAAPYLEQMALLSQQATQKRFGKTIQLYAPLYLSNECQNICTYCGFSLDNQIPRKTLTAAELLQELLAVKAMGYQHILLVTGEAQQLVGMSYFRQMLPLVKQHFQHIAMEVQPLDEADYAELRARGVNTILVYQETYHREDYRKHHPKGKKSNFDYRLACPDRIGRAGIHKIGIGALLGLDDWRTDSFFAALHLQYLERTYWQSKFSVSFPRLRPHVGGLQPKSVITDRELVQLICAWRLFNGEVELSMSTRESPRFRDNIIKLGITSISAGSKTNPGGYAVEPQSLEQFEIDDGRSPAIIAQVIREAGYEPVWKDWDHALHGGEANGKFPLPEEIG
ncbi:2-iminoacetate synthase [Parapedobacter luteus]|uniref:2-iminoacetate synthase n=1 Tax=Parapedobacter luteus TaxID=623280 RepID=A0A1T5EN13_9SPHI|nr:2-iminoacetate synthase ThiH [Parapedobacter luteus]SKB85286.1 2-iminoacetate synthase [Parapedobacter luteus]